MYGIVYLLVSERDFETKFCTLGCRSRRPDKYLEPVLRPGLLGSTRKDADYVGNVTLPFPNKDDFTIAS